ncbi:MAG: WG repeat-containing protein, partial [Bacteroidota bacterium]|nr:WG repeat-containing protein [Bacteroidota bacterium]
ISPFNIDSLSAFRNDYAVIYQGQKQGLIDRNGATVVRPEYGEVRLQDDGAVLIRKTNTWYFLHGDNKLIAEHHADDLRPLSADRYAIYSNGKLQLTGNDLKPLHEDFFSSVGDFTDGIACYRKNSHTGVITANGKTLIEPRYRELAIEPNGFRACLDTREKNRWVILNRQGTPVSEKHYEYIAPFTGKFYPVKNRGFWGVVDASGAEIVTCVHDSLIQELNDNVVVKFKGEYGVINLRESWIVTPQPNPLKLLNTELYMEYADKTTFVKSFGGDIIYFSENPLHYSEGYIREQLASGAYWRIDLDGIVIERSNQPEQVEKVFAESEGLRCILKDGKFGFIDDAGRLRIANRYEDARPFSEGLAAIRIRGKWGFIDRHEKLVVQPVYDEAGKFVNGKAIVTRDGLFGLIDTQGRIVLPLRYDEISPNPYDRFLLRQGKAYGLADASGVVIVHPRYDGVTDTGNGYVVVQRDGKFGALTLQGVNTIPMIYDGLTFDAYHNQFMAVKKSKWEVLRTSHSGQ